MSETEFRCDWKSWCVRIEGHDGDCEPATESKLHTPATPLDSALVLAARCARCQASPSVRCRGSINEPVTFHLARFVLASVIPVAAPSPETGTAAVPTPPKCPCPSTPSGTPGDPCGRPVAPGKTLCNFCEAACEPAPALSVDDDYEEGEIRAPTDAELGAVQAAFAGPATPSPEAGGAPRPGCPNCNGSGLSDPRHADALCPVCEGDGKDRPCKDCGEPAIDSCPNCDALVCQLCAEKEGESCCDGQPSRHCCPKCGLTYELSEPLMRCPRCERDEARFERDSYIAAHNENEAELSAARDRIATCAAEALIREAPIEHVSCERQLARAANGNEPGEACEKCWWCRRRAFLAGAQSTAVTGLADCVKCIKCRRCCGACDCTGGALVEPECTCYELPHQPGCYFNRPRPSGTPGGEQ